MEKKRRKGDVSVEAGVILDLSDEICLLILGLLSPIDLCKFGVCSFLLN